MDDLWAFLSQSTNQEILTWLGGGVAIAAGGAWAVIRFLVRPPDSPGAGATQPSRSTVRAKGGGIVAGRDVTVRSSQGISGAQTVLLLLAVVGALVLVAGLAGGRIAAVGSSVVGGNVENSTIIIGSPPQGAKP
jgi:hypothetical protein